MPTSRRVAFCWSSPRTERSFLRTSSPRGGSLVVRVDLVERVARDLVVDALAPQLVGQRAPCQPLAGLARLDPRLGEGLVVDQADLLEPVEQALGQLAGHVLLGQLVGELLARARLPGQGVEQDLARDRLRIGIGSLRHRVGRRRRCGPAPVRGPPRGDRSRAALERRLDLRRHPLEGLVGLVRLRGSRLGQPRRTRPGLDPGVDVTRPRRRRPVLAHRSCHPPDPPPTPGCAVRSHSRRSARRRGRRRARRPAVRRRASPGSSSPARWPGRGCP